MWQFINGQMVWVKDSVNFRRMGRFSSLKMNMEGEGGSGSGGDGGGQGSGDGGNGQSGQGDVQKQLAAMQESMTKLEAKRAELLEENKKMKSSMQAWDGLDPEQVRSLMKKIEGDEELKLLTEGKHEEVVKRRTEKVQAEYESKLRAMKEQEEKLLKRVEASESKVSTLLIDNSIAGEFTSAGGLKEAVEDIKLRAKLTWRIEDGEAIPRDAKGQILQGKDGIMTQREWIESLRQTAPHLFPKGQGAGADGNGGPGNMSNIDMKIEAARKAGDIEEVRRLKNEKAQAGKKR